MNTQLKMMTAAYARADKTESDCVVCDVHKGGKKLADMVEETVEPGSRMYADEYKAYDSLGKRGYRHETVNHSEGEYASGETNKIHANSYWCLVGLPKWWLKKHRVIDKKTLHLYTKSYDTMTPSSLLHASCFLNLARCVCFVSATKWGCFDQTHISNIRNMGDFILPHRARSANKKLGKSSTYIASRMVVRVRAHIYGVYCDAVAI